MEPIPAAQAVNYQIHEIANIPRAFDAQAYNKLSAQEEGIRRRAEGTQERIGVIDTVKTIAMDAVKRILEKQLEILNTLLHQRPQERNFAAVPLQLEEKLKQLYKNIFLEFAEKIGNQEIIIEDGVEIILTEEREQALKRECQDSLDKIFRDSQNIIKIDSQSNLQIVKTELESQLKTKTEMHERVVRHITTLENTLFGLNKEARKVLKIREKYFALEANDLHTASELGDMQVLTNHLQKLWFFQKYDAVNEKNRLDYSPLHIAAFHGHLDVLSQLLSNKGDPNLCDGLGYQPLHWASKKGSIPIATLLLGKKAQINGLGAFGRTPLHMSVFNSHEQMTDFLLQEEQILMLRQVLMITLRLHYTMQSFIMMKKWSIVS